MFSSRRGIGGAISGIQLQPGSLRVYEQGYLRLCRLSSRRQIRLDQTLHRAEEERSGPHRWALYTAGSMREPDFWNDENSAAAATRARRNRQN